MTAEEIGALGSAWYTENGTGTNQAHDRARAAVSALVRGDFEQDMADRALREAVEAPGDMTANLETRISAGSAIRAVRDAAAALACRDDLSLEDFDVLTSSWRQVIGDFGVDDARARMTTDEYWSAVGDIQHAASSRILEATGLNPETGSDWWSYRKAGESCRALVPLVMDHRVIVEPLKIGHPAGSEVDLVLPSTRLTFDGMTPDHYNQGLDLARFKTDQGDLFTHVAGVPEMIADHLILPADHPLHEDRVVAEHLLRDLFDFIEQGRRLSALEREFF